MTLERPCKTCQKPIEYKPQIVRCVRCYLEYLEEKAKSKPKFSLLALDTQASSQNAE